MPIFVAWDSDARRAWRFSPSLRWIAKHDNSFAVSIGFKIGEHITMRQIETFVRIGRATEIDYSAAMAPKAW